MISAFPNRIAEGICISGIMIIVYLRLMVSAEGINEFIPKLAAFAMVAFRLFPSVGKIASRATDIFYYRITLNNDYENMRNAEIYEREQEQRYGKIGIN